jgi:PiT family inorganic phosphate transporter
MASQDALVKLDARPQLSHRPGRATLVLFFGLLLAGLAYTFWSLKQDVSASGTVITTVTPFLLLGLALLIALGFEFVNGFHDTANAVATVIYTHSLPAPVAVVWSGCAISSGLLSSGAVAFGIIALLPVELILQVGSGAGFAMVFALLLAAIIWNLGTWWLGLPASSSHTLIGSIIGVGVANALMHGRDGTSGVDWGQASKVGYALLFSPLIGFACAALLLLALRALVKRRCTRRRGPDATTVVDPRCTHPHLHRRVVRPRLQRRAERHGPDHADPGRHPADGLRAEQDHAQRTGPAVLGRGRGDPPGPGAQRPQAAPADPRQVLTALSASPRPARNWCPPWPR